MSDISATDRGYRRGLVLGLSLAELFIILVFLLLLASLGFMSLKEKINQQQKAQIEDLTTQLSAYKEVIQGNNIDLDKIDVLVRQAAQAQSLIEKNRVQAQTLTMLKPLLEAINSDKEKQQNQAELIAQLAGAIQDKDFDTTKQVIEIIKHSNSSSVKELATFSVTKQENVDLRRQKEQLASLVEALGKERGDNPPCLYKPRDKGDKLFVKKPYKEIYSFDIFIKKSHLIVFERELEVGDYGSFFDVKPQISPDKFGKLITYKDFRNSFSAYKIIGQEKKVQPYPCAFFAKVWWDKNMDSVEYENGITQVNSIFFKDVMRSEAWPHGKT